ncbi:MAG: hypothetical protein QXQ19_02380 [Candidatus Aenigmatarchaeota archaeon]
MEIKKVVEKNFGSKIDERIGFEIRNDKIYFFNKELKNVYEFLRLKGLKVEKLGIYFGRLKKNEKIQLSIEGAQFVGKDAKKNLIKIDDFEKLIKFLKGEENLEISNNVEKHNFPIVKYKDYIICSAASLENEIKSLFPKNPRKMLFE